MSDYYNPKRTRNLFDPESGEPFRISRSKIDLFAQCQKCFYLDVRQGVGRPPGFPFALNRAVDKLLKKEFDIHRNGKTKHPLCEAYGIDAIPFAHEDMDIWRENFKGIRFHHKDSNLLITGAVDDVWSTPDGQLHIVDYKATSKDAEVSLDAKWQDGYKRQMEIYQWLFRRNGFNVSDTGYFVYVNGKTDRKAFDGKLEFDVRIIPYTGDDSWVEKTLLTMKKCLMDRRIPMKNYACDYCNYVDSYGSTVTKLATSAASKVSNKADRDQNNEGRKTLF